MDEHGNSKNKLDLSATNSLNLDLLKIKKLSNSSNSLSKQINKSLKDTKVETRQSRIYNYVKPRLFHYLNIGFGFLQWLILHITYLLVIIIVYNVSKLLKITNPRIMDIITNTISYGIVAVWLILFFLTYFYHSLFFMFYLNSSTFVRFNFSYIFTYHNFSQFAFVLSYGLLACGLLTMLINGYSLFVFRQSFGQIFMNRISRNVSNHTPISRKKIACYLFIHSVICATFFVWPIFLVIVLLSCIYYGATHRNWCKDLLKFETIVSSEKDNTLLRRFVQLFSFYYRRKAAFVLDEVPQTHLAKNSDEKTTDEFLNIATSLVDTATTQDNHDHSDNVTKVGVSPITAGGQSLPISEEVTLHTSTTNIDASSPLVSNSLESLAEKRENGISVPSMTSTKKVASLQKKTITHQPASPSAFLAQLLNFWIYLLAVVCSFASVGIWSALRSAHATSSFFKLFFLRIISPSFRNVFNEQILSRLYLFKNENGNIVSKFLGWNNSLQFNHNFISYSIVFIPHASSWHDIWNNIEFIIAFLIINFKYSPTITLAWLLLFFIAFWFFLNIITIVLAGNTFFGFCFTSRRVRLVHKNNFCAVSLLERIIYAFAYVACAFLYIIPIVNIIWIFANLCFFCLYRETVLNRMTGFRYGVPKHNFKSDLLDSIQITNNMFSWVKEKFYKELIAKDNI